MDLGFISPCGNYIYFYRVDNMIFAHVYMFGNYKNKLMLSGKKGKYLR